jgi:hypothetical protein
VVAYYVCMGKHLTLHWDRGAQLSKLVDGKCSSGDRDSYEVLYYANVLMCDVHAPRGLGLVWEPYKIF